MKADESETKPKSKTTKKIEISKVTYDDEDEEELTFVVKKSNIIEMQEEEYTNDSIV